MAAHSSLTEVGLPYGSKEKGTGGGGPLFPGLPTSLLRKSSAKRESLEWADDPQEEALSPYFRLVAHVDPQSASNSDES